MKLGMRTPMFLGLHAESPRKLKWILNLLPFILMILIYLIVSAVKLAENPYYKILPSPIAMLEAIKIMALEPDRFNPQYILGIIPYSPMMEDTAVSLQRIFSGLIMSTITGLLIGLNMGIFPGLRLLLLPFIIFLGIIPALALLPILFVAFGVDELAKIMLIAIGTFPMIAISIYHATSEIPNEQITKSLTLGATPLQVAYKIILPQIIPCLIDIVRVALGSSWLFLLASEFVAASSGLGYRINIMFKPMAMNVILPYVMWITLIGYTMDILLKLLLRKFPWYFVTKKK